MEDVVSKLMDGAQLSDFPDVDKSEVIMALALLKKEATFKKDFITAKKAENIINNIRNHPCSNILPKLNRPASAASYDSGSSSLNMYYDKERMRLQNIRSEERKLMIEKQEKDLQQFKENNKVKGCEQVEAKLASLLVLRYNGDLRMKEERENLGKTFKSQNRISREQRAYKNKLRQFICSQQFELKRFDRKVEVELQHFDSAAMSDIKNQTGALRRSMPLPKIPPVIEN